MANQSSPGAVSDQDVALDALVLLDSPDFWTPFMAVVCVTARTAGAESGREGASGHREPRSPRDSSRTAALEEGGQVALVSSNLGR